MKYLVKLDGLFFMRANKLKRTQLTKVKRKAYRYTTKRAARDALTNFKFHYDLSEETDSDILEIRR